MRTTDDDPLNDDNDYQDEDHDCWYCRGEGWGVIGDDWDCDDAINGPYDGEVQRCPCCHGTGKAKDCTFW